MLDQLMLLEGEPLDDRLAACGALGPAARIAGAARLEPAMPRRVAIADRLLAGRLRRRVGCVRGILRIHGSGLWRIAGKAGARPGPGRRSIAVEHAFPFVPVPAPRNKEEAAADGRGRRRVEE